MSGVRIYIATSEGPIRIQRILAEDAVEESEPSAVCLNGTATRLGITKDYTYFVRDHIRPLTGKGVYRMDLDSRIDGGNSWMLGSWIAHQLLHGGCLAMHEDEAELAVFATGQVAFGAGAERKTEIREVSHISDKVARMVARVDEEVRAGRNILFFVPQANVDAASAALTELPEASRGAITLHSVAAGDEVFALLPQDQPLHPVPVLIEPPPVVPGGTTSITPPPSAGSRRKAVKVFTILALMITGGVLGGGYYAWQNMEQDWRALWRDGSYTELIQVLEAAPHSLLAEHFRKGIEAEVSGRARITVLAQRPADGETCAGIRFRNTRLGNIELPTPSDGDYRLDRPRTLCGFVVKGEGTAPAFGGHLWVALLREKNANVRTTLLPSKHTVFGPVTSHALTLNQDLPLYRSALWRWHVVVIWTPGPSTALTALFDKNSLEFDETALKPLAQLGIAITRARITLTTTERTLSPSRLEPRYR